MQRLAFGLLSLLVVVLGACTTISSGSSFTADINAQETHPIKAKADALVEMFTNRGWTVRTDPQKQVSKFTNFITSGWGKTHQKPVTDVVDVYLNNLNNKTEQSLQQSIIEEINLASEEISSLSKGVTLSATSINSNTGLRAEMLSLEKAVLTSHKANKLFVSAASRSGFTSVDIKKGLQDLQSNIETLTRQTDAMQKTSRLEARGLLDGSS